MKKILFLAASIAALSLPGAAVAQYDPDQNVRIMNDASSAILQIHVRESGTRSWGVDLLGSDQTLVPNHYMTRVISSDTGGCYFDFKFVMEYDDPIIVRQFNACERRRVSVEDDVDTD